MPNHPDTVAGSEGDQAAESEKARERKADLSAVIFLLGVVAIAFVALVCQKLVLGGWYTLLGGGTAGLEGGTAAFGAIVALLAAGLCFYGLCSRLVVHPKNRLLAFGAKLMVLVMFFVLTHGVFFFVSVALRLRVTPVVISAWWAPLVATAPSILVLFVREVDHVMTPATEKRRAANEAFVWGTTFFFSAAIAVSFMFLANERAAWRESVDDVSHEYGRCLAEREHGAGKPPRLFRIVEGEEGPTRFAGEFESGHEVWITPCIDGMWSAPTKAAKEAFVSGYNGRMRALVDGQEETEPLSDTPE